MCAEKDPLTCHRAIFVCPHLKEYDLDIQHIKSNGEPESHGELEDRMLAKHGFKQFVEQTEISQLSLFEAFSPVQETDELDRNDCLMEAYKKQGNEIAYVETKGEVYA